MPKILIKYLHAKIKKKQYSYNSKYVSALNNHKLLNREEKLVDQSWLRQMNYTITDLHNHSKNGISNEKLNEISCRKNKNR